MPRDAYDELYDEDLDPDDEMYDPHRLKGRHSEHECRLYRQEMRLRALQYEALGCGREYRQLTGAEREALPEPARKVPQSRRLPAPKAALPPPSTPREEDVK